jgi:hypothetical protein
MYNGNSQCGHITLTYTWAGKDLYCATPAVTRDLSLTVYIIHICGLSGLFKRYSINMCNFSIHVFSLSGLFKRYSILYWPVYGIYILISIFSLHGLIYNLCVLSYPKLSFVGKWSTSSFQGNFWVSPKFRGIPDRVLVHLK